MIVPMKKAAIIMQPKDAEAALYNLRALGILHIEYERPPSSKDISRVADEIALVEEAQKVILQAESLRKNFSPEKKISSDWKIVSRHIIDLSKRLDQLQEYSRQLINNISQWERWGDFNPEAVQALAQKGIYLKFYQIPNKELKKIPSGIIVKNIFSVGGVSHILLISDKPFEIQFKEIPLPKMSLLAMRERLHKNRGLMQGIEKELFAHAGYLPEFLKIKKSLQKELEFFQVLKGMGEEASLVYLSGYAPYDRIERLGQLARQQSWGINITEPTEEDRVPTLIRNPRWVSIINPLFKVIEVVPGYRELDISFWFLIFFSIFFGMLIGDMGYGLIYFILTFFAQQKLAKKLKSKAIFMLFYLLSLSAIAWGALTGTFFGQEWLGQWVKPIIPALRNDKNLQTLCFLLGAAHLSIAHLWRAIVKLPSLRALADLGWLSILWAAFFLARTLILAYPFPEFAKWFIIAGIALVVFFTAPKKNILKGMGAGVGNLLLNLVNNFTDVVSYIRLFAVGLATVAVADAFNQMALGVGYHNFLSGLITSFILLVGHTLNVLLGPMSVLVHGVRLNVLEFCNHLDIKWSGFSYQPFKEEAT